MAHFTHHSEENYLKTLYKLRSNQVKKMNNTTLAKELDLNPATVLEMVRKLAVKKLVQILSDKSIRLTEKGEKKALLIIRKHRLWEVFLTEKLQYNWNEVHVLAEQLEHIESVDLVDRLDAFLKFPTVDPHGDPIPDKNGNLKIKTTISLDKALIKKNYTIVNLADTNDIFLQYLGELKIKPGIKLKLLNRNEYDATVSVIISKKTLQLSNKVAKNILLELVN